MKGSCWLLAVSVFLVICGSTGCGGGSDDVVVLTVAGDPPGQGIQDANLCALHSSAASTADNSCITCHGDMTDDSTLDADVIGVHSLHENEINYACTTCHVNTDLINGSGAKLREQVDPETICDHCHGPGGIGPQLYQQ